MDDDEDNSNITHHHIFTTDDVKISGRLETGTTDCIAYCDPDQLIGAKVIDMIMNKPEFSFLTRYYSLLYQSLIPNCKLTINILRQHITISDAIEQYIADAASRRTSCQRLINFLLTRLYSEKDYMQFCYHLNIISVMTDLPDRLKAEFHSNGNWGYEAPKLHRDCYVFKNDLYTTGTVDVNNGAIGALSTLQYLNDCSADNSTLLSFIDNGASDDRADKCSINIHYRRRQFVAFQDKQSSKDRIKIHNLGAKKFALPVSSVKIMDLSFFLCSSGWRVLEKHFNTLCSSLPHNYQLTIDKLNAIPQLLQDGGEQLSNWISSSSSTDVRKINKKIITYLVVKLCYNVNDASLCEELIASSIPSCEQQIIFDVAETVLPSSISTETVNNLPQRSSLTPEIQSPRMEYSQHNILPQPSSSIIVVSDIDTHTTFSSSPVATLSVVGCLTTGGSVNSSGPVVSNITPTASIASSTPVTEENRLPQNLHTNEDFTELKAHYHTILRLMPVDYEQTVGILLKYISDDQLCVILSSNNATTANKIILDCLIERISCKGELLDLCDQLESITTSHDLKIIINEIRFGVQQSIQFPISTAVTTNTQSLLSTDQQYDLSSPGISNPTLHTDFSRDVFNLNSIDLITNMQDKLKYKDRRLQKGFKYLKPPPLPSYHINRENLLDEIATKLLQVTNEPSKYEATLIITGAGGFGKTTTVISLCYYPAVEKQFTDGFIFIELGPQATDSSVKLRAIYNLLTNEQCEINVVEQKLNQLTNNYYRNLLVIIDDVWHVEDAQPIVKAFTNCKIILTTRMNDIEQYIPSKQSVTIGPMTQTEAISLLTYGIIDSSQLSQEDMSLLNELAHDVHLWPLLLSLIRGQLSHNLKQYRLSQHKAIKNVQAKLHHKGLTAFDKNIIETINKSRNLAVKACIEVTLELLTKPISDKIKTLIVWTGIGTSFQTAVLSNLWNIVEQEAEDTVNTLWAYGLVQFSSIMISSNNNTQHYVEVHAVISQYIIESMDSQEVIDLSPCQGLKKRALCEGLILKFQESYGIHDELSVTSMDYLKYKLSEIENIWFPYYLKFLNMFTVTDPHIVITLLQEITDDLTASPYSINLFSHIEKDVNLLTVDCKQTLNDAHKICRVLNQNVQRILYEKNYDKLIQTVEEYINNYPLCNIAQKAITMVKKIMPYCDGQLLHSSMIIKCELLHIATSDYHEATTMVLPTIKLYIKLHKQITSSLLNGSPYVEMTYNYIISGKFNEEERLTTINRNIKLLEVAPHVVSREISEQ